MLEIARIIDFAVTEIRQEQKFNLAAEQYVATR